MNVSIQLQLNGSHKYLYHLIYEIDLSHTDARGVEDLENKGKFYHTKFSVLFTSGLCLDILFDTAEFV